MVDSASSLLRPFRGPVLPALERLAPPPPESLVAAEIDGRTSPGDIVVELHGRGGWVARTAINRLRRVIDLESCALTRLVSEVVLRPPDLRHLDAAVNAMAVQPRGNVGLRAAINDWFTSTCAACSRPVVVEEFVWDGDAPVPARKSYRCGACRNSDQGRLVSVDRDDMDLCREIDAQRARDGLALRFPTPAEDGETLVEQVLDLYTPRTLNAIAAIADRIDHDLRPDAISAALRLALVHMALPASRLNSYPGRVAALRISGGRVRRTADRQWRERNPWLLFEEGTRIVRAFVQRLQSQTTGLTQARLSRDLAALLDGSANVMVHQGSTLAPDELADLAAMLGQATGEPRVKLVIAQLPTHWSPENLSFAYLATSLAMGREAASTLPLEALYKPPPRGEWAWDSAVLRRSLAGIRATLAADARVVVLLDKGGAGGLVAAVLGGVAAGYRLSGATLAESGDDIGGTLELLPPTATVPGDLKPLPTPQRLDFDGKPRPAPTPVSVRTQGQEQGGPDTGHRLHEPGTDPGDTFHLSSVERAVSDLAVGLLQERGEPARFERLLGDVMIGLDRMGHLRRLVGTQTFSETVRHAEAAAEAAGVLAPPVTALAALPEPGQALGNQVRAAGSIGRDPVQMNTNGHSAPPFRPSWRDPSRPIRTDPSAADVTIPPSDVLSRAMPTWNGEASGSDPVSLLLEIVMGELRRPDHPRLRELEGGRWWLREPADVAAARMPLSDRLEWAVFSLLSTSDGLTEAAFFSRVAAMFRGHDTPDEEFVRACLESYRTREPSADGLLRTEETLQERTEEHGALVGMLAEYGHRLGLRCWIAPREQRRTYRGAALGELLSEIEQRVYLPLVSQSSSDALEAVDCIWYLRGKATFCFEVEWTAMLDEPVLRRGPRIASGDTLVRFLVVPPERTELLRLKLTRSPLLRQRIEEDNWHILKADNVRRLWAREEASLESLEPMLGLDPEIERQGEQLALF